MYKSSMKILLVLIVSIIAITVAIPILKLMSKQGFSDEFVSIMFGVLFIGIIVHRLLRQRRK